MLINFFLLSVSGVREFCYYFFYRFWLDYEKSSMVTYHFFSYVRKYSYPRYIKKSENFLEKNFVYGEISKFLLVVGLSGHIGSSSSI